MRNQCSHYTASQFFKDVTPGKMRNGFRCENLEAQTFENDTFDLVITQDVFEHIFDPNAAHREIYRTLKPGGVHIFTVPIYKGLSITQQAARLVNGEVEHILPPEYHGNPVDDAGSLVTFRYGSDYAETIGRAAPFGVEIHSFHDARRGLLGEFLNVVICLK